MTPAMLRPVLILFSTLLLAGCMEEINKLLEDPKAVQREADAKATGSACRFGLRSIEDCYVLNPKASKSAIFAGWKEMDQYMRENKVEGVPAKIEVPLPSAAPSTPKEEEVIDEKPPAKDKKAKASH
jgi:hypothetical protein